MEGIEDFPRGIKLIRDRGGQFYSSDVVQIANADDSAPITTLVTSLTPPAALRTLEQQQMPVRFWFIVKLIKLSGGFWQINQNAYSAYFGTKECQNSTVAHEITDGVHHKSWQNFLS